MANADFHKDPTQTFMTKKGDSIPFRPEYGDTRVKFDLMFVVPPERETELVGELMDVLKRMNAHVQ